MSTSEQFSDSKIEELEKRNAELEAWKAKIIADLQAEAEARDWCDEFEEFMKGQGVEPPLRDYEVEISAEVHFAMTVQATDADNASNRTYEPDMAQALRDAAIAEIRGHGFYDHDVNEVSRS